MERSPFQMSLSMKRSFRGGQEERNQIYRLHTKSENVILPMKSW